MLSVTTDYVQDTGSPEPYLRAIGETGFTHVHWCHHWNTDFLYATSEIDQIAAWLDAYGLRVLDIHASHGREKAWASPFDYQRLAGIELVQNRIAMAAALGSDVIILHLPRLAGPDDPELAYVRSALDALAPYARDRGVRIALENMGHDDFAVLRRLFALYPSDFLGLCYDAGHGNLDGRGLEYLETVKDRLISVHLHDNDGTADQHRLVFSGTIDWARLARILATSSYEKCVNLEISMKNEGIPDESTFLARAYETGAALADMIVAARLW
jgi:sugar phosphate isomerase/epimerase